MDSLSLSGLHASVPHFHLHQQQYAITMQSLDHDSLFSSRVSNLYSTKDHLHRKALLAHLKRLKTLLTNNIHPNNINQEITQFQLSLNSIKHHLNTKQSKSYSSSSSITPQPFQIKQSSHTVIPNKIQTHNLINYHQLSKVSHYHNPNPQFSSVITSSSTINEPTTIDVTNSPITPITTTHIPIKNTILNSDPWIRSSYNQTTYVPPLMSKLFYSTELNTLFSQQLKLQSDQTFPTIEQSLQKATNLYNLQLRPATTTRTTNTDSYQCHNLYRIPSSISRTSLTSKYHDTKFNKPPSTINQQIIAYTLKNIIPNPTNVIQKRTYHRGMTKQDELHAPTALWRHDGIIFFDETNSNTDKNLSNYSHAAYAVSNDHRQHSTYYNQQGVFQNPGTECGVARNFGYQRQTNYPFRKTYIQPYNTSLVSSSMSSKQQLDEMISQDRAIVSKVVSNRIPVDGLSPVLLSLTKSGLQNYGRFFTNDDNFSTQVVQPSNSSCMNTTPTYIINQYGRLIPHESSTEDNNDSDSKSYSHS